jgi:hypothetical protein
MSNNSRGNDKSILQKIADTVKDIAAIATDAANDALKAEAPAPKANEAVVTDVPLAALGLVSDPMMVPPMALIPARNKQRAATRPGAKKAARKRAAAKKSAAGKSRKAAKKTTKKTAKKAARKTEKKTKKSSVKKTAKKARKSNRR